MRGPKPKYASESTTEDQQGPRRRKSASGLRFEWVGKGRLTLPISEELQLK